MKIMMEIDTDDLDCINGAMAMLEMFKERKRSAPPTELRLTFNYDSNNFAINKIKVIKLIREKTGLGLPDSKAYADKGIFPVSGMTNEQVEKLIDRLNELVANVETS